MTECPELQRSVVFHADDFGMNPGVNQGIIQAFQDGLLTSTSLLANAPCAEAACREWPGLVAGLRSGTLRSFETRQYFEASIHDFDLGVHLNLTQGRPLTGERFPSEILDSDGTFPGVGALFHRIHRVPISRLAAIEAELEAQVAWMCDNGLRPTHLNGHQYVELIPPVSAMILGIMKRFGIPVVRVAEESHLARNVLWRGDIKAWGLGIVKRHYAGRFRGSIRSLGHVTHPDRFFGTSHAGRIDLELVLRFLDQANQSRFVEIGVHPAIEASTGGDLSNDPWFDPLERMRPRELAWLCGSELPRALANRSIRLGRLHSLG